MDIKYLVNNYGSYRKQKKRFSETQLKILNDIFNENRYSSTITRNNLSKIFKVRSRKIQIWFQNKRYKERKRRI
ncbi:hypothetical protein K492DRAFT_139287 [Lichtheimia hyalospora FSU 10163]|nr:hypothetical protein K492DRAFT_139287 [Lichtheimia hyalospora FSU 10163]